MANKTVTEFTTSAGMLDEDELLVWDASAAETRKVARSALYTATSLAEAEAGTETGIRGMSPLRVRNNANAAIAAANNIFEATKTITTTSVTQVLASDAELQVALLANQTYRLEAEFYMQHSDGATGGTRINFVSPSLTAFAVHQSKLAIRQSGTFDAALHFSTRVTGSGTSLAADDTWIGYAAADDSVGPDGIYAVTGVIISENRWKGIVSVGATGGNFIVQWGQFATTALAAAQMLSGSFIKFTLQ